MIFEEWLETTSGKACLEGRAEGVYLRNRLWHAFMAGQESTETTIDSDIKKIQSDIGDMFNKGFPSGGNPNQVHNRQKAMKVYDKVCKYLANLLETIT